MSDLLSKLSEAGQLEARGRFTIDSDKAREKLRQYQLADPHRHVLLLVEAMVLAGARRIEFEIDADDVRLYAVCRPFSHAQLGDLYGSIFMTIDDALDERVRTHMRGLQQLASALNSAMALNPRFIRVESVDAEGLGVALVMEPERPDQIEVLTNAEPGTRVHVRDRFRPGLVVEFFRSLGAGVAEQKLLRRHCRWSAVEIVLDDEVISGPIEFEGESWFAEPVVEDGRTLGRAALHLLPPGAGQPGPAYVDLLCHGVWFERVLLESMTAGFAAIIDDDRLGRDVSQTHVLRDAAFDRITALLRVSEAKLIARLAERGLAGAELPPWAESTVREWLALRPIELDKLTSDPQFAVIAKLPLWLTLVGPRRTTLDLIEHDPLYYSEQWFDFTPREVAFVVDLGDEADRVLFKRLFGRRGVDHAPALQREFVRDRQRTLFLTRSHPTQLSEGYYLRRAPIVDPALPVLGELGLRSLGPRDSWVRLVREGCLLQELRLEFPIPGLCSVVEAMFTPDDEWVEARPDELLARVALELLRTLERMLRALAESGAVDHDATEVHALLRAYVRATCDAAFVLRFLAQFGFTEPEARNLLRKLDVKAIRPEWKLELAAATPPHPIARVPLYTQAQGRPLPLEAMLGWRRAGKRIAWLDHDIGPLPQLDQPVVLLDVGDRTALRVLFGDDAFERYHDRLARLRRRELFLAQPKRPLGHSQTPLVVTPLVDPRLRGELGLCEFSARTDTIGASAVARIRLSHCERPLPNLDLELPLPGLVAWVDSDRLELDADFRGLARIADLRPVLSAALGDLVRRQLQRLTDAPNELRRCELWFVQRALALVLTDASMLTTLLELRAAGRASEMTELLGLLTRWSGRELDRVVGRLRGRKELPTRAAVERELGRATRPPSAAELELAELRIGLAGMLDELLAAPLLRVLEGTRATTLPKLGFGELLDQVARQTTIAWVPDDFRIDRMPEGVGRVLALDPIEQRICAGMLGASALEDVRAWLAGRANFERRRRVDEIRLPHRQALIQIAIAEPELRGEIGIVRESPDTAKRTRVRVFHLGREITSLDLPAEPLALVGALEFTTLELTPGHDDLTPAGRERVRAEVGRRAEVLLTRLIDEYPQLAGTERTLAAELVRRVLLTWPPGSGGHAARAKHAPKRFAKLAELPVFPGARRPWTASELAEANQRGPIATIEVRVDRPLPDGPVIVLERPDVLGTLHALFARTRDLSAHWAKQAELAAIKATAPKLPEPPANAIASLALSGEGLAGHVWWAPGIDFEVALGREGRSFGKKATPAAFPCAGALQGMGLQVNADWTRVSTSRGQDQLIDQGAHDLWLAMIDEFEAIEAALPAGQDRRRASLRDALRAQFLRLRTEGGKRGGGKSSGGKRGKPQTRKTLNKTEAMFARLCSLKILPLAAGHHISPEVANRERPAELAALDLWDGPSADELQRAAAASERKAAEQRRLAELERQREEERERRRVEAAEQREAAKQRRRRADVEREAAEREAAQPKPAPKPKTEPKSNTRDPAKKTPEHRLLEAIRTELRLVRGKRDGLLGNHHLEALVLHSGGRGRLFEHQPGTDRIHINLDHPLVCAALEAGFDDPARISLLASATYTFLNLVHTEITDENEAEFLRLHAAHVASHE